MEGRGHLEYSYLCVKGKIIIIIIIIIKLILKKRVGGGQPTRLVWTVEVCCGGLLLARQWGFGFR